MSRGLSDIDVRPLTPALRAYRFANRPQYIFRPSQVLFRSHIKEHDDGSPCLIRTAWGTEMLCWPDPLGRSIARTGVYDLVVAETLARLAGAGETAVDAGANVGFMTNVLSRAVGPTGQVVSFEPHPLIFDTLAHNVALWSSDEGVENIDARRAAVSVTAGTARLFIDGRDFAANKGTASLEQPGAESVEVETVRLDGALAGPVGVLKLDVEGHELAALNGAEALLSRQPIRDVVFEEHELPPTPVTTLLEAHGYVLFGLRQGLFGPILCDAAEAYERKLWDPPSLLATADPERARRLLEPRGWLTLSRRWRGSAGLAG
jgi:FkbM family methyltransferase